MNRRIAGCVVLFNPDNSVIENIKTYGPDVDTFVIIDNSPLINDALIESIKTLSGNYIYEWQGSNVGIAKALNAACRIAIENNCEWLLTMDQDSWFSKGDIPKMVSRIGDALRIYQDVGILTAGHKVHEEAKLKEYTVGQQENQQVNNFMEVRVAMTSGNLLNLNSYLRVGPFSEKLFIDHVDHEYCLRLRKNNYRVIQVNEISLNHTLGSFEVKSIVGKKIKISNHSYQRRYYITRNGLCIIRQYWSVDRKLCLDFLMNIFLFDLVKVLFFEREKWMKAKAIWLGIYHFMINRYGKYELRN